MLQICRCGVELINNEPLSWLQISNLEQFNLFILYTLSPRLISIHTLPTPSLFLSQKLLEYFTLLKLFLQNSNTTFKGRKMLG